MWMSRDCGWLERTPVQERSPSSNCSIVSTKPLRLPLSFSLITDALDATRFGPPLAAAFFFLASLTLRVPIVIQMR